MEELSRLTKNFSGAEIEGLVKSAASYAFTRGIDVKNLDKAPDPKNLIVTWQVEHSLTVLFFLLLLCVLDVFPFVLVFCLLSSFFCCFLLSFCYFVLVRDIGYMLLSTALKTLQ